MALDANGIWQYTGTETAAPVDDLLNLLAASLSDQLTPQDYVPTWTNVTVGNGTVTARYTKVGKTVTVSIVFTLGSTSAIGGAAYVSLPVTPRSTYVTDSILGHVGFRDASGAWRAGAAFRTGSNVRLVMADGTNTAASTPWTWTTGDVISVVLTYEAA